MTDNTFNENGAKIPMTTVPSEIQQRVNARLHECIAIANTKYSHLNLQFPNIDYKLRGTNAGVAQVSKWLLSFNSVLLMENLDHFIKQTVPHELAHLIAGKINPNEARAVVLDNQAAFGFYRKKPQHHGPTWQSVMHLFGLPATRCHQYDVKTVKRTKSTSRVFCCRTCGKEYTLGLKSIQKWQRNSYGIWGRCCGRYKGTLVPKEQLAIIENGKTIIQLPASGSLTLELPKDLPVINGTIVSKMTKCRQIYGSDPFAARSWIINRFVKEAGCTKAGANTYYYQLSKRY